MSFSKGTARHHFRPSGFRPPRPFTPPMPGEQLGEPSAEPSRSPEQLPADQGGQEGGQGEPAAAERPPVERPPERVGPVQPSQPRGPDSAFTPGPPLEGQQGQPSGHRQPQHRQGHQQGRGNQRHDQRGGQQGGHRQGGQHGQPRGQQGGQSAKVPQQRSSQPHQPQPHRHGPPQNRGQREAQAAAPVEELPVETAPVAEAPVTKQQTSASDTVPLPPQPVSQGETLANPTAALQSAVADTSLLAPFSEDIEIDESLSAPVKRREPTGRDMLINVVEGEEVRIAVIRRGQLEELYMERSSTESHIGNIYKGRVTNVEPSIQAAFIDFGIGKNGFLHISDLHPQYFPKKHQPRMPQQRRQAPRPQAASQPPAAGPSAGFQPPPAAPAAAEAIPVEPTESPVMPHAAGDAPAVGYEAPVTSSEGNAAASEGTVARHMAERTSDFGAEGVQSPTTESASAEGAVSEEAAAAEGEENGRGNGSSMPSGETVTHAAEEAVGMSEDAAEEEGASPEDEPADFGSAYNAEFSDEEEDDFGGYEGGPDMGDVDDGHMKPMEKVGRKTPRRERPPIQQCLRRGQEIIVQVTKEGIGTKGPTLTTYVSCPGRYLVMMPGMSALGVSRKIEDLDQRRELKRTLQELNPPRNLGFIIRTAGTDVSKKELQGDLNYLVRMWKVIANRIRNHKAPVELYQESDLVIRTIRDVFNDQIDRIIVDNEQVASRIRDFLSIVDPRSAGIVELYTGTMPLYQKFGVEREIEKINSRRVELNNGGSLVIDSTEALVAIDVNSGRYRDQRDAELTAFNMNKEALKEVVRQLRLRDLGGVIVIDFIDMREERHKREIERLLREEMENDRARTKVLRMSQFCMIEMTRQRVRPSLKRSIYMDCPHCHGSALIKTPESVSLDVMRRLAAGATRPDVARLEVRAYPTVATFLLNRKRKALVELEDKTGKRINITADPTLAGDQLVIEPFDARESRLNVLL
jgi:Rne/Rng family ribonuclease